jgi:hypothetical protein
VGRRLERLDEAKPAWPFQGQLPFDDDGEHDPSDQTPDWTSPGLRDPSREKALLASLAAASGEAIREDSKLRVLAALLLRLRRLGERAIVFTEYRDTLLHVRSRLALNCLVVHGGMDRDERRAALRAFSSRPGAVLLATDAAGEGLNLQNACRIVINLELPWSPVRLEQRAGRVDRIGQQRTVHVFYLIARASAEMKLLNRLAMRIARARIDIDVNDPLEVTSGRDHSEPGTARAGPPADFLNSAAEEHQRLLMVRRLGGRERRQDPSLASDPLLAFSKHSTTRAQFRRRVLLLFESVLEDPGGRRIAAYLAPVLLRLDEASGHWRDLVTHTWRDLEQVVTSEIESANDAFRVRAGDVHRAFWRMRIEREQAIARRIGSARVGSFQPGLFDRRAASGHKDVEDFRAAALQEAAHRVRASERASGVHLRSARLALILVP